MDEIAPGLFVGDYAAAQDTASLARHGVTRIVAAMRHRYEPPPAVDVLRVLVDDTPEANLIASFDASTHFIREALAAHTAVLVHCQAGQSRSPTLVAAYLMAEHGLTAETAVAQVRAARPQIEPSSTFMAQLEMYERSGCDWNPSKWSEQRRFLMNGMATKVLHGTPPSILMAYYPSPVDSPLDPHADFSSLTDALPVPANAAAFERRRLTPRSDAQQASLDTPSTSRIQMEKIGVKGEVVILGRKIRCKMCRRELAGREHVIEHETGKGQHAFAPRRRDMNVYRAEQEKYRVDEKAREARERDEDRAAYLNADAAAEDQPTASTSPKMPPPELPVVLPVVQAVPIAGLRISQPRIAVPGLRVAVPRPRVALPTPNSIALAASLAASTPPPAPIVVSPLAPVDAPTAPTTLKAPEPPLLPSHLCSSYFLEPMSWMSEQLNSGILSGKLVCPNTRCAAKIGSFDWAGSQCSCGAWVCPGFAIGVAKVDEIA